MALTKVSRGLLTTSIVDNGNDTAITISSSKNVGIGIGLPASLLDVASTGEVTSTVRSTSTSGARQATLRLNVASTGGDDPAGRVQFTYGMGYTVAGSIEMSHTNPAMKFLTGTTEVMRISGSNVGIGTQSPDTTLHLQTPSGTKSEINFAQTAVTNYRIGVPASTDALVFTYGASTERIRIDASGNVGIGTSSPATNLDGIFGLSIQGSTSGGVAVGSSTKAYLMYTSASTSGALVFWDSSNNAERMRISTAGVITTPYQPSFQARLSVDQAGFNSSGNFGLAVGFNVTDHNVGNHFNTSTGLFTAPVAGLYSFEAATYINTYALQSWYVKNGGRVATTDKMVGDDGRFQDNNTILLLAANDTVGFHPFVVGDTNVTIINNANHTYFKGYLIG